MKINTAILALASLLVAGPVWGTSLSFNQNDFAMVNSLDADHVHFLKHTYPVSTFNPLTTTTGADHVNNHKALFNDVPVPAAAWLFMSGLVGMIGIARRKAPPKS